MKNKVIYIVSSFIFLVLLAIAIPFHLDATNKIVGDDEEIQGLFLGEERERKFRPREYIQRDTRMNELQPVDSD